MIPKGVTLKRHLLLPGQTRVAGYYDEATRTIHLAACITLADGPRELANPTRLLAHEAGHAMDHALGWPSRKTDFAVLLDDIGRRMDPRSLECIAAEYYLTKTAEAFAECYAVIHGAEAGARFFGILPTEQAYAYFGDLIQWVEVTCRSSVSS